MFKLCSIICSKCKCFFVHRVLARSYENTKGPSDSEIQGLSCLSLRVVVTSDGLPDGGVLLRREVWRIGVDVKFNLLQHLLILLEYLLGALTHWKQPS